jgi:hypothetical protein
MAHGLSLPDDLPAEDRVFHCLAGVLDDIPAGKHRLFLAKLVLLLALRHSPQELETLVATAANDL